MGNGIKRDAEKAARVIKVARKNGLKEDTVYAVVKGDRVNEKVLDDYITLAHIESAWENNTLLQAVIDLVPFY